MLIRNCASICSRLPSSTCMVTCASFPFFSAMLGWLGPEFGLSKAGTLAVEGFETRVWVTRDGGDPQRIKSQPIPAEVLARFAPDMV